MPETAEQYIKRILGHVEGKDAMKSQAAAPRKFERLIRGVPKSRLMRKPAPGKWSVGEILAHLSDTELVVGYRIRTILENNGQLAIVYRNYGQSDETVKIFNSTTGQELQKATVEPMMGAAVACFEPPQFTFIRERDDNFILQLAEIK